MYYQTPIKLILLTLCLNLASCINYPEPTIHCQAPTVPVVGHAQALVADARIKNATIHIMETGQSITTNQHGQFAFCALPKRKLTLTLTKNSSSIWQNYHPTQSATVIVPPQGLTGPHHEITFQTPREKTYRVLQKIITKQRHFHAKKNCCQVVTTITAYNKTLKNDPQGISGAHIKLMHNNKLFQPPQRPFYFAMVLEKTNPFSSKRTESSEDGGVIIYNLPASKSPYTITAEKPGMQFSNSQFICRAGALINLSPPHGPTELQPLRHS